MTLNSLSEFDLNFFLHLGYFPGYTEKIVLDPSGIDRSKHANWDYKALLEEGIRIFQNTIAECFETYAESGRQHVVPLSGGLDSRALLAALLECTDAANIHTYTFGTPGTYDYDLGCDVAHAAGTQHRAIDLSRYDWSLSDFEEAAARFQHQTFVFHHAPLGQLEPFCDGVTWSGYIGDAVTGGHLKSNASDSLRNAQARYLKTRTESKSYRLTNGQYDLRDGLKDSFEAEGLSFDEQVLFGEVGSITAPHVLMDGFHYETPFINSPIWDFFMSLPDTYRYDQSLFVACMLRGYPKLFGLPSKHSFGLKLDDPEFLKFIRRTRNKLWNIGRTHMRMFDWPALPMMNFFDIDKMLFQNNIFSSFVYAELQNLKARNCIPWVDIDKIWSRHMSRKAYHGDVIKLLFSLELNLKGRGL